MRAAEWFLLGAPWDSSGTGRGEEAAPDALRAAGLDRLVGEDLGDAAVTIRGTTRDPVTRVRALPDAVRAARALAERLTRALRECPGGRPLVVGGDCSLLIGVFPALREAIGRAGLWYVDGHPDYLDGPGSDTGETADMALAILTGAGAAPLVGLAGAVPMLSVDDAVLVGHRTHGLDDASAAELERMPPALRRMDAAILARDPAAAGGRAEAWLADAGRGAWLHLDLDVLDPRAMPAVSYPQPGGPDWDQLAAALAPLARSSRLVGVSVADYRPDLDPDGALAARVVRLLGDVLP